MSGYNSGMLKKLLLVMAAVCCAGGCRRQPIFSENDQYISSVETIEHTEASDEKMTEKMEEQTVRVIKISVYVCGQVRQPGVYELIPDARVVNAIEAAGGALEDADLSYMNLADHVNDGEKIYVPSFEETAQVDRLSGIPAQTVKSGADSEGKSQLLNLNTASKEELMTLPGIGESKADAIIAYRDSVGRIDSPSELMNIPGIKDGIYSKLKDRVCVD